MFAVYMPPHAPSPGQIAFSISVDLLAGHLAREARADRLERVDDRDVAAVEPPGQRRAGVEEHRGDVEAGGGHQHAGLGLVASGEQHGAVELLGAKHRLDRIRDHLARDERVVHAVVAHRDAVGDRDRAELQREAVRAAHADLRLLGEAGK